MSTTAAHLAKNIRQLRERRGLSQVQLAKLAGLPRPTWAHLESGAANPTIAVLIKAATALQVSLEELVTPPKAEMRHYKAGEIKAQRRGEATLRKLLPDAVQGVEFDRVELPPGARMGGIPHRAGTREYLACERGRLSLTVGGDVFTLDAGDVVVFRGDQRHGYANAGSGTAVGYSVVLLAPGPLA